jgi:hypothetical protein
MMQEIILGDYDLIPDTIPSEGELHLRVKPIDMVTYWRRCGAVANFIANFYRNPQDEIYHLNENLISTTFNELIENAAKYSTKRESDIGISLKLYNTILKMEVENICSQKHMEAFQKSMEKIIDSDNDELDSFYLNKIEAKHAGDKDSGIGLLMLKKDYSLQLSAKITPIEGEVYRVSVHAYYSMNAE